jgi:hypothetical protein
MLSGSRLWPAKLDIPNPRSSSYTISTMLPLRSRDRPIVEILPLQRSLARRSAGIQAKLRRVLGCVTIGSIVPLWISRSPSLGV